MKNSLQDTSLFAAHKRTPAKLKMLQIMCLFKLRNNAGPLVAGRPGSESGVNNQGQHVTAFALVKKGFTRRLIAEKGYRGFSSMRDTIIAYVERLSILERFYAAGQPEPSDDTSSGGGGGGGAAAATADIPPVKRSRGSNEAPSLKSSEGEQLNECITEVLQLYSETRSHKSYLRQASEDIKEGCRCYNAMKALDMEDIQKVLSSPQKRKEEIIEELIKLFEPRFVYGNKNKAISQFKNSLEECQDDFTVENCFHVVERHNLSRSKSRGQEIEFQKKANLRLIEDVCETLAELSVAYYNRMRGVSFNRADTNKYPVERMTEAAALKYLDERYCTDIMSDENWLNSFKLKLEKEIKKNNRAITKLREKLESLGSGSDEEKRKTIEDRVAEKEKENQNYNSKLANPPDLIKALAGLFDYPAVKRKKVEETSTVAGVRDNSIEKLTFLMARHLHIAFNVYPEAIKEYEPNYLSNTYFRDQIILPFVSRVLFDGWNGIVEETDYGDIASNVLAQMSVFFPPNKALQETSEAFDSSSPSSDSQRSASGSSSDQEEASTFGGGAPAGP
jgi:hypothetical protein